MIVTFNKQPMSYEAQLTGTQIARRCPVGNVWDWKCLEKRHGESVHGEMIRANCSVGKCFWKGELYGWGNVWGGKYTDPHAELQVYMCSGNDLSTPVNRNIHRHTVRQLLTGYTMS